ncbi:2-oxo acid dehydrogenase subunit E2 [Candidatus Pelagibacter communis]|uniref:2-oxo acid dehydrogenase subunit E2 n=1 Tax=Pelagibacter ubique TaxID=198252 RepID=UPI00094C4F45|nr:2-oxo acid dehydrogenase subunit E2 [Candidatus Pelagibacter ubique]
MSEIEIKVPNIGDFKDVEVIEVLVSEGQTLKKNDPLITIESDKSSVEIPSNFDGKIKTLKTKVGDKVSEGDLILILENINEVQKKVEKKTEIKKEIKKTQETKLETQKIAANQNKVLNISSASPKVRKFARELGVDINQVAGSERKGRVIESDIKLFVASKSNNLVNNENKSNEKTKQEYSHSEFGEVEIKDIPRVKKLSSKYLMNSWTNIPHVTNHDEADITELEEFRTSLTDIYTGEKKKITPLAFIVKALTVSLKKFPNFNSSIDDIDGGKMTVKKYYHIGIAVDTPHGLMVPKLRNADNKNINLISSELKNLSDQCRNLKIDKKELFGGSMTITSLGGIGGSFFTPIINFPEVAILGIGRSEKKQVFLDGKFVTRTMLPLSLSYDHRIIDGAEAARFNNELKENLGKNFAYKLAV